MLNALGDCKKFILEDIGIYSAVIVIDLGLDFFPDLFRFVVSNVGSDGHPRDFGILQGLVLGFAVIQLVRKIHFLKHYHRLNHWDKDGGILYSLRKGIKR